MATIADGRTQTQMPAFGDVLDDQQIEALVSLVFEPLAEMPTLDMAAIEATREVTGNPNNWSMRPSTKPTS